MAYWPCFRNSYFRMSEYDQTARKGIKFPKVLTKKTKCPWHCNSKHQLPRCAQVTWLRFDGSMICQAALFITSSSQDDIIYWGLSHRHKEQQSNYDSTSCVRNAFVASIVSACYVSTLKFSLLAHGADLTGRRVVKWLPRLLSSKVPTTNARVRARPSVGFWTVEL